MALTRRRLARIAAAAALGSPSLAGADTAYPSRPVRMVLPFAAGGGSDVLARVVADALAKRLGQRVLVENITGAGGTIGTERVVRADPDGHTLLVSTMNLVSINPALYRNLSFDIPNGLLPVSLLWETGHVVVVDPRLPFRSLADLAEAARARPRAFAFASGGTGTTTHLYGELFRHITGVEITHVAYRGNAPALADVMAGHVAVMFDQVPNSAAHVRAGRVRAIAVTTPERQPFAPDVPTATEAGMPGLAGTSWAGLSAPRGAAPPVIAHLNAAVRDVLAEPELKDRLEAMGATARASTAEAYGALVASELAKWSAVIRAANLSADP